MLNSVGWCWFPLPPVCDRQAVVEQSATPMKDQNYRGGCVIGYKNPELDPKVCDEHLIAHFRGQDFSGL